MLVQIEIELIQKIKVLTLKIENHSKNATPPPTNNYKPEQWKKDPKYG